MGELDGQVALVTGGGRGIGRAIAEALAAAGEVVVVTARSSDQLAETVRSVEQAGGHAFAVTADVTDRRAVERLRAETEQRVGPIDILVNNAGQVQPVGPLWTLAPDAWRQCLDINLHGTFLCSWATLPGMVERRKGCIINLISGASLAAIPYGAAYVVAKTAVLRLTECIAAEAEEHGVRVFAVNPGVVRTAMADYLVDSPEGQRWHGWFRDRWEQARPAVDTARLCVALACGSNDALSGRYVSVDDDIASLKADMSAAQQTWRTLRLVR